MNSQSKLFLGVFLLLFVFGMIFLSTLFLFGKSEYLTLGIITQLMILGNFLLWRYSKMAEITPFYPFLVYLLNWLCSLFVRSYTGYYLSLSRVDERKKLNKKQQ